MIRSLLIAVLVLTAGRAEEAFKVPTQIVYTNGTVLHSVEAIRWEKDRVVVKHRGGVGPVFFRYIKSPDAATLAKWRGVTEVTINQKKEDADRALAARRAAAAAESQKREREETIEKAIRERKVMVGMTTEQVIESWGRPKSINSSGGIYGKREQWVYISQYLYFVDGLLASWQQSREG